MIISYSCDRCHNPIAINRTLIHVVSGPACQHHPAVDLCVDCASSFVAWLKTGSDDIADTPVKSLPVTGSA